MLVQKPYQEPYIPNGPAGLPYVGAELESITSDTPFWRGQGIPIYPFQEGQYKQNMYYAGPFKKLRARFKERKAEIKAKNGDTKKKGGEFFRQGVKVLAAGVGTNQAGSQDSVNPYMVPYEQPNTNDKGLSLGVKVGLGAAALIVFGIGVRAFLK